MKRIRAFLSILAFQRTRWRQQSKKSVKSDIQLYLDLKSFKERGEEAAQAIFEQRIMTKW
jgi:hypothetical protein